MRDSEHDANMYLSGSYPDGVTAADIPDGHVEYRLVDDDAEYEDFVQRCDDGLACYVCKQEQPMIATSALGIALWRCPCCGAEQMRAQEIIRSER